MSPTDHARDAAGDLSLLGSAVSVFKTSNQNAFRWGEGSACPLC